MNCFALSAEPQGRSLFTSLAMVWSWPLRAQRYKAKDDTQVKGGVN